MQSAPQDHTASIPHRKVRRSASLREHRFRPRLEGLEGLTLLSTLTVTNALDSGAGSLRAAIKAARDGDTLVFAPALTGQTITLTGGELVISKSLDIEGPGAGLLTVSGNNASRVFNISKRATAQLAGLTVTHGQADHGGGILNGAGAHLTLSDVCLSDNRAANGLAGGAVFNDANARLSIRDSTLTGNRAETTGGFDPSTGGSGGGAIFNETGAELRVARSDVSGNVAVTTVGFDNLGGALYNNGGTATINDSTLANNQVLGGGSFSEFGGSGGGAIENGGGAILTVTGSSFASNLAMCDGGDPYYFAVGGAIDNDYGSSASISSTQFTGNRAQAPVSDAGISGSGGAIQNGYAGECNLSVTGCSFTGNQATGGGGGFAGGGAIDNQSDGILSVTRAPSTKTVLWPGTAAPSATTTPSSAWASAAASGTISQPPPSTSAPSRATRPSAAAVRAGATGPASTTRTRRWAGLSGTTAREAA